MRRVSSFKLFCLYWTFCHYKRNITVPFCTSKYPLCKNPSTGRVKKLHWPVHFLIRTMETWSFYLCGTEKALGVSFPNFLLANASCTTARPDLALAFCQSHKRQTNRWFPGHLPNLKGSHRPGWEARGLRKGPGTTGSGPLSAGGGWCKGTRSGREWWWRRPRRWWAETGRSWVWWMYSWNLKYNIYCLFLYRSRNLIFIKCKKKIFESVWCNIWLRRITQDLKENSLKNLTNAITSALRLHHFL